MRWNVYVPGDYNFTRVDGLAKEKCVENKCVYFMGMKNDMNNYFIVKYFTIDM